MFLDTFYFIYEILRMPMIKRVIYDSYTKCYWLLIMLMALHIQIL